MLTTVDSVVSCLDAPSRTQAFIPQLPEVLAANFPQLRTSLVFLPADGERPHTQGYAPFLGAAHIHDWWMSA